MAAKMDKKLTFMGDSWVRYEKNEDDEKVKREYKRGDIVLVTSKVRETLLTLEVGDRPLFREPTDEDLENATESDSEDDDDAEVGGRSAGNDAANKTGGVAKPR